MSDFGATAIVLLLLGVSLLAPVIVLLARTRHLAGDLCLISRRRLVGATSILLPFSILLSIFPVLGSLALSLSLSVIFVVVFRPKELKAFDSSPESIEVISNLQRIQADLVAANRHLHVLASKIELTGRDIDEKERRRVALETELAKHVRDVHAWQKLSQEQRDLMVEAAKQAVRRKTIAEAAAIAGGGLLLNLAASLVWALLGSPGKQDFLKLFHRLFR